MAMRLGDLLVNHGVLTIEQRDLVVAQQRVSGRPFGLLAEEMHGVDPRAVERAWAEQYAGMAERESVADANPSRDVLAVIEARQAWQFGVVPLRMDTEGLVLVTTKERLARALRFAGWRVPFECRFALTCEDDLVLGLERLYPMAGLNADSMRTLRLVTGS